VQVNAQAAARILAEQAGLEPEEGGKKKRRSGKDGAGPTLLDDDRFKVMFEDPEFAIDERSTEWKLLHPNMGEWSRGAGAGGRRALAGTAAGRAAGCGWCGVPACCRQLFLRILVDHGSQTEHAACSTASPNVFLF
jgi:hypothetical protein